MHRSYALLSSAFTLALASAPGVLYAQAMPGVVQVQPNEAESEVLSDDEALALDATVYAEQHGVSPEEAMRRIVIMTLT